MNIIEKPHCHNCGKDNKNKLQIVDITTNCNHEGVESYHVHIFHACENCAKDIWELAEGEMYFNGVRIKVK